METGQLLIWSVFQFLITNCALVRLICFERSQDLVSNSPYCPPYNSYEVSLEKLVFDQLISAYCYVSLSSSLVCLILH